MSDDKKQKPVSELPEAQRMRRESEDDVKGKPDEQQQKPAGEQQKPENE